MKRIADRQDKQWALWERGDGSPLLLLHGGWAGAQAHWSSVWDALAADHHVIAPDLPGIAAAAGAGWPSYAGYVDWLAQLLDRRDVPAALVVGNSFGATLAYLLAAQHPQRCRGLVMVDGFPPPEVPSPLRWLMRRRLLRLGALAHMRRHIYGPKALRKGFCDPARAPTEVKRALEQPEQSRIEHMLEIVLNSRRVSVRPQQPILIVWGADDHLPKAELAVGRRLHQDLPGSRFEVIEQAGHMPQVEQPDRFVRVLRGFVELLEASAPAGGGAAAR